MAISLVQEVTADTKGLKRKSKAKVDAFVDSFNQFVPVINETITLYNEAATLEEKLELLKMLHADMQQINAQFSNRAMSRSVDYISNIHVDLFREMKHEFEALGLPSMQPDALRESRSTMAYPTSPAELIANTDPVKLNQLAAILQSGKNIEQSELAALYQVGEADKATYDEFFNTHSIAYLGGGNSLNFVIQHKVTREACVLKLENRMGMPSDIEMHLRENGLQDVFTTLSADRMVSYLDEDDLKMVTRRLVVTELCKGRDLVKQARRETGTSEERITRALDVYTQMGDILSKLGAADATFPDMKNSNWLMDESGRLRIADTKAFLRLDEHGNVIDAAGIICSGHLIAPEMRSDAYTGDKMHVYMMGKNMYQYLMQYRDDDFYVDPDDPESKPRPDSDLKFDAPIFNETDEGRKLAAAIQMMMNPSPDARPSLLEASAIIEQIKAPAQQQTVDISADKKACAQALLKVKALGMGAHDTQMNTFFDDMKKRILVANNPGAITAIRQDMLTVFNALKADESAMNQIKAVVDGQHGENADARKEAIQKAVGDVPLKRRGEIATYENAVTHAARAAIKAGQKATNTQFQDFKARSQAQSSSHEPPTLEDTPNKGPDTPSIH
ncbi:MAG: hypothetical protein P1U32_00175 [Legionellaceae bacterium]|nr:hypothetical protein [Legionellaceae bacterium]